LDMQQNDYLTIKHIKWILLDKIVFIIILTN
jgi:hypothetical protein